MSYREQNRPDPVRFIEAAPRMIKKARAAAYRADTHRVHVGAAAALQDESDLQLKVIASANHKPTGDYEVRKHCAETKLFARARRASKVGSRIIHGLVVAGPSDRSVIESITRIVTPTLHCCDVCLGSIDFYQQEGQLHIDDDMPVLTTHASVREKQKGLDNVYQVHSVSEMRKLHVQGHGFVPDPSVEQLYDDPKLACLELAHEVLIDMGPSVERARPAEVIRFALNTAGYELGLIS